MNELKPPIKQEEEIITPISPPKPIEIPISNGELLDRITILQLKIENLPARLEPRQIQLENEASDLRVKAINNGLATEEVTELSSELYIVNKSLWMIEDSLREYEQDRDVYNQGFTTLARLVYTLNDLRSKLKKQIDKQTKSKLTEVKTHIGVESLE